MSGEGASRVEVSAVRRLDHVSGYWEWQDNVMVVQQAVPACREAFELVTERAYSVYVDEFVLSLSWTAVAEWAVAGEMSGREPTFYLSRAFPSRLAMEFVPMPVDLDKIRALAERVAASHGLAIVEVEHTGSAKDRALRIYIEKDAATRAKLAPLRDMADLKLPEHVSVDQLAGITVEDCQVFSDDFGTVLDVEDCMSGQEYTLEVSSPGLDRKLYGPADYVRFTGSIVKLRTTEPVNGNAHWQGRIASVDEEGLELDTSTLSKRKNKAQKTAEAKVRIAFANISKANLVPEI